MAETYTYSVANDTKNGAWNQLRLKQEIDNSAQITQKLQTLRENPAGTIEATFYDALPSADETYLTYLVGQHDGKPITEEVVQLAKQQSDGVPRVALAVPKGEDDIYVTHNYCDPCTWYEKSDRVTDQTLTDSGDGLTFESPHTHWIDIYSGRIQQDDYVSASEGTHGYLVEVKVDGVTMTKDAPFDDGGAGDYYVDWEAGNVVFKSSQSGKTVTASYSKSSGDSTFVLKPPSDKIFNIVQAETDFSTLVHMKDEFIYGAFGPVDIFAPQLTPDPYPSGTMIPLGRQDTYKRAVSLAVEAVGSFPKLYKVGASEAELQLSLSEFRRKSRGMFDDMQAMPFMYEAATQLNGAYQMELRVWLKNHTAFGGENAFVTFRVVEEDVE